MGQDGNVVFPARDRTEIGPAQHSESTSHFLDRVAGAYWDQVRLLLNEWSARMPPEARPDVHRRLRSPDTAQFIGAWWEVFVHEMLRRGGYTMTVHPPVGDTQRRPDFLAQGPTQSFYVEAKALVGRALDGAGARKKRLYDALDRIHSPDFLLRINVNEVGPADLPVRPLRRGLEAWLGSLDADTMLAKGFAPGGGPEFAWSSDGWDLTFSPLPIRPEARGLSNHRPLAVFGPPTVIWVNDHLALREALADKGSAYGDLDQPLLIAINSFATSSDDSDTVAALYGSEQITFSLQHPELPAAPSRHADGYWLAGTWAHQHVAAVLIGRSVMPWTATRSELTMWTHPDADTVVAPMACWRHAQLDGPRIAIADAESSAATLFGLPADWPHGEAFPR